MKRSLYTVKLTLKKETITLNRFYGTKDDVQVLAVDMIKPFLNPRVKVAIEEGGKLEQYLMQEWLQWLPSRLLPKEWRMPLKGMTGRLLESVRLNREKW